MYIHILIYMYIHTYIYAYFHTYIYMYIYVVSIRLAHMWIAIVGQHLLHSIHEAGVRMQFSRTCEVCCSAHVNWDLLSQFTCWIPPKTCNSGRLHNPYRNAHVLLSQFTCSRAHVNCDSQSTALWYIEGNYTIHFSLPRNYLYPSFLSLPRTQHPHACFMSGMVRSGAHICMYVYTCICTYVDLCIYQCIYMKCIYMWIYVYI